MTERYYFGNARFATRSDGRVAIRWWDEDPARMRTWETRGGWKYDEEMADEGWVPVPSQAPGRTITESDYSDITEWARNFPSRGWEGRTVLAGAGITIVPDSEPEPTEAEKLAKIISEYTYNSEPQALAEALVRAGVKAPEAANDQ